MSKLDMIFQIPWDRLKAKALEKNLDWYYILSNDLYTVIVASPAYALVAGAYGEDAIDFETNFKAGAIQVRDAEEAMGLSVVTNLSFDGKSLTGVFPATPGLLTYFTSRGDIKGPPIQRGEGQLIKIDFGEAGERTKEIEVTFAEPIEIHDAEAFYTPIESWTPDDSLSAGTKLPATPAASTPGVGNANKIPVGPGAHVFIPAAGNGEWTIALGDAVPIPTSAGEPPSGFWDVNRKTGAVTPSPTPGNAPFNLFDFPLKSYIAKNVALGHPLGVWEIDPALAIWIHPNWTLFIEVKKPSPGSGVFSGSLFTYRHDTR